MQTPNNPSENLSSTSFDEGWRTMDSFVPPPPRTFNYYTDHLRWYWVSSGKEPQLCYYKDGCWYPVHSGGMVLDGRQIKYWKRLNVPTWPVTKDVEERMLLEARAMQRSSQNSPTPKEG